MTDYRDLIGPYHRSRPKFSETVQTLTDPVADSIEAIRSIIEAFDLDAAIGAQLDILGEWIGRSRTVFLPVVNLWFSLNVEGRGFDQGEWFFVRPAESTAIQLDDDKYRQMLRAKIAANHWDGSAAGALTALRRLFAEPIRIFVDDKSDMSIAICWSGTQPALLDLVLFSRGYVPLKASGVETILRVVSVDDTAMFGFDVENQNVAGLDSASWGLDPEILMS